MSTEQPKHKFLQFPVGHFRDPEYDNGRCWHVMGYALYCGALPDADIHRIAVNSPAKPVTMLSDEQIAMIEALEPKSYFSLQGRFQGNFIPLNESQRDALCQTVRVLRLQLDDTAQLAAKAGANVDRLDKENAALREQLAQENQQRGLVLLSALTNFVDWLFAEGPLSAAEKERSQLVLRFLAAHSEGKNYFMQADQIAERLGEPFREEQP